MHYVALVAAIIAETIGTSALTASQQFTKLGPSIVVVVAYAIAFYLLSISLRFMPVGVVYAIWSGMGIVLIALAGYFVFGQTLDLAAIIGLGLIIAGVLVLQLFSSSTTH